MILYKKAAMSVGIVFGLIMLVIAVLVSTGFINSGAEKAGESISDAAVGACQGTDGEGLYSLQKSKGWCPCDIDDVDNNLYSGKLFEVNIDRLENQAKRLFTPDFLSRYDAEHPLQLSQTSLDNIEDYINQKRASVNTPSTTRIELELDFEAQPYLQSSTPDLLVLCPSLENIGRANSNCDIKRFMEDWIVDGVSATGECRTPEDICKEQVQEKCKN